MRIFIDESGNFTRRSNGSESVSAVGSLVIPHGRYSGFEKLYSRLRHQLPQDKGGVKGRLLSEDHIAKVCSILKRMNALFEVVATDLSIQSDDEIARHQTVQADMITKNLNSEFSEDHRAYIENLSATLRGIPRQLYLQSVCLHELIHNTINHADLYFVQRFPNELARYSWTIDAKGSSGITNWEKWWLETLLPIQESKSIHRPLHRLKGADYSAHEKFKARMSDYKCEAYGLDPDSDFVDMNMILKEDLTFSSSADFGLEAVDILINGIRRALMGNLKRDGWLPIREIMIHRPNHYIKLVTLGPEKFKQRLSYGNVMRDFKIGGKSMLTPSTYSGDGR